MFRICHAVESNVGRKRDENEDAWFACPEVGTFGVSDGMGGQAAGKVASQLVVEILPSLLKECLDGAKDIGCRKIRERVCDALRTLNGEIYSLSKSNLHLNGMGATIVAAIVRGKHALVCHMGDSRAYLMREDVLEQLTRDHCLSQLLVEAGEISAPDAASHPGHFQLTRFVGMQGVALPEVDALVDLQAGDRLLLCSDGLTSMVPDERICKILKKETDPAIACMLLHSEANVAGGKDNITTLIVEVKSDRA